MNIVQAVKALLPKPVRRTLARIRADLKAKAGDDLAPYFTLLSGFDDRNPVALDLAHNLFIIGSVLAKKPENILELGMGSGYLTTALIHAINYNKCGMLTTVDSWLDTNGDEPAMARDFRAMGVNVMLSTEEDFVRQAPTNGYDLLMSDADHFRSQEWLGEHIRITRPDGLMFFHDTNNAEFPGLLTIETQVAELGLPYFHFKKDSRENERCSRGLLFVINKK